MDAKLVRGVETIIHESRLTEEISDADWVITGEGRFDSQSLRGKVVSGVTKVAIRNRVRVGVIAGAVVLSKQEWQDIGINAVVGVTEESVDLDYAIINARSLLANATKKFAITNLR